MVYHPRSKHLLGVNVRKMEKVREKGVSMDVNRKRRESTEHWSSRKHPFFFSLISVTGFKIIIGVVIV